MNSQPILDKRYILLDTSQTAKNALDTLFQDNRAYGDFKADFDHFADRAKYDNRTKVELLKKGLNRKISNVIDNQVNLPGPDDFLGWSDMVGSIARNLQQQEHIFKLQTPQTATRQNEPITSQPLSDIGPSDIGDPMDLSRIKLSDAERKYRMYNGLCIACGENGHLARDHYRKNNLISMSKRPPTHPPNRNFQLRQNLVMFRTTSLIDSDSTAMVFADNDSTVKPFRIKIRPLFTPRTVRLADGTTQASITHYFTYRLHIDHHSEIIVFFVTTLSKSNPIILGLTRLKLHNSICDWTFLTLKFDSLYCHHHCLNWVRSQSNSPQQILSASRPASLSLISSNQVTNNPPQTTVAIDYDLKKEPKSSKPSGKPSLEIQSHNTPPTVYSNDQLKDPVISGSLKIYLDTLRRKAYQTDIDKFLESKSDMTIDFIKKKLPPEFHHHAKHFLPKNANFLPPHHPWDH
ncbi:hypothetical protein EV44_g3817 [Erysiphe necator]|uniref:CCHC-type domain-containing protein n=1 Tax=Uncinula necator TaxID=52586 RepID=A0A0B1PDW9_UNCNE|nr:hypothetical protein EV44_g3817 [Erysiphe necator]